MAVARIAKQKPYELTRRDIELVQNWNALPENERNTFARAIAARAEEWRRPDCRRPAIWPIVIRLEQDPRINDGGEVA